MNNARDACYGQTTMSYFGKFATILRAKTLILMPKLKQFVTQYKMWNEVMLWLTQIMSVNAYIAFLIRQIDDREENLIPTSFDVPDSTHA